MTSVDGRRAQLNKAFGELIKKEGLTSWKDDLQANEQEWCDVAQPYSYRDTVKDLLSRTQRAVGVEKKADLTSKRHPLPQKKTSQISEESDAKRRALQLNPTKLKHANAVIGVDRLSTQMTKARPQTAAQQPVRATPMTVLQSPTRAERREIEVLREQHAQMIEDMKVKDTRNRLVIDKLKRTIAKLQEKLGGLESSRTKEPPRSTCIQTEDEVTIDDMMGFTFNRDPSPLLPDSSVEGIPSQLNIEPYEKDAQGTAKRTVYPNGYVVYQYSNKDVKHVFVDGNISYYSQQSDSWQQITPQGIKVTRFSNSQVEKTYVDDSVKITFPNGTVKWISSEGETETAFPDGVRIRRGIDGRRTVFHPSGIVWTATE